MKKVSLLAFLGALVLVTTTAFNTGYVLAANTNKATTTQVKTNNNVSKLLTGNKLKSRTVNVFIEPNISTGVQQDIKWGVSQWSKSTNKLKFKIVNDRNIATIRFTTGQITNYLNARTFYDQMTPNGSNYYVERTVIKISTDMIDQTKLTNSGIRVVEHEIGHSLGLADVKDANLKYSTVMWYMDPNTDITSLDRQAINTIYR